MPAHGLDARHLAPRAQVVLLFCHAALYAGFLGLSVWVVGRNEAPAGPVAAWSSLWFACGLASVATLCVALLGIPNVRLGLLLHPPWSEECSPR